MKWTEALRTIRDFRARALDALRGGTGRLVLGRRDLADLLEAISCLENRLLEAGIPPELDDAMHVLATALSGGNPERVRAEATTAVVVWQRARDEQGRAPGPVPEHIDLDAGGFR